MADSQSFTLAGAQLAQIFSCELVRQLDTDYPDYPESPRLKWAPECLLLTRICYARSAAIGQGEEHLARMLDFRFAGKIKDRLIAARQVTLAILFAADPDANEYISPNMCELAELQYETTNGQILGCGYVPWYWEERYVHLCPGSAHHSCPTPLALKILEHRAWPDGSACGRGSVLLISAEDDPGDTIRPRLDAHDADPSRAMAINGGSGSPRRTTRARRSAKIGKEVSIARMFMRQAVRWGMIPANSFEGVRGGTQSNRARFHFIPLNHARTLIQAAPDADWRCIIALARFGGLRCPSEVVGVRWGDVDWANNRFRVRSPKTERHEGKEERLVPLFPELRSVLMEAFEQAPQGAE